MSMLDKNLILWSLVALCRRNTQNIGLEWKDESGDRPLQRSKVFAWQ